MFGSDWGLVYTQPRIEIPANWDWRVPVMRPQAPAADLEQFRSALVALSDYAYERHGNTDHPHCLEADRLLALIDGQKAAPRGPDQPNLCDLCRVREEVRSDAEGIPFCQECWDGWQASDGEGAGHG